MACADCPDCGLDALGSDPHSLGVGRHEVHVTFDARGSDIAYAARLAFVSGFRLHHMSIALPDGGHQPEVMTGCSVLGTDAQARDRLVHVADTLDDAGFAPVRVKIETTADHPLVPATIAPDAPLPNGAYWESHVKGWLTESEVRAVADTLRTTGYVSANLAYPPRDGRRRCVVTRRDPRGGPAEQARRVARLRTLLESLRIVLEPGDRTEVTWLDLADSVRFAGPPS